MPQLTPLHPDDFTLLRYTAGDLDDIMRHEVNRHIGSCAVCSRVLGEIEELDQELKQVTDRSLERRPDPEAVELSSDDPFRVRRRTCVRALGDGFLRIACQDRPGSLESSGPLSERILEAANHAGKSSHCSRR